MSLPFSAMPISATAFLVLLFDLSTTLAALLLAFGLRFNFAVPQENLGAMWNALPVMLAVHVLWFVGLGTYRPLWRFTSISDVRRLAAAVLGAGVTTPVALLMLGRLHLVPRSLMMLAPIVLFLMLIGARLLLRAWFDGHFVPARSRGRPVVILGAGDTAARLIADLQESPAWEVVAVLDDNESLHGSSQGGINIYGGIDFLPNLVARFQPIATIIALPFAASEQRVRATQLASGLGLNVFNIADSGNKKIQGHPSLQPADPVELLTIQSPSVDDQALSDMVLGKVVLITGIDSPLGQAFCRQVLALQPKTLLCLDRSAKVLEDLQRQLGPGSVKFILGDCRDEVPLKTVFEQHRPDVVCHLSDARFSLSVTLGNEWETLRQNMLPVLRSVRHAVEHKSGMFIHITRTGEAAESPLVNAGLRLAEAICLAAHNPLTRCVPIRLGPDLVLAHDDLILEMTQEIELGGPVPVSDPQSERCFMRETDAARLALQAVVLSMQSKDRNEDSVYLIRGGAPIRVTDFARKLIKLAGFSEEQIPIVFTGSEKQPNAEISSVSPTTHPEILLSRVNPYLVTKDSLEEIASWLDMPTRNVDQIAEDLSVWGIVTN